MLTIWGRKNSTNVKKVLWLLDELGETYQQINAGGVFGKVNDTLYLSLNPNGLVPCLQEDNFILWESNAILRYLAERSGNVQFWPVDLHTRAQGDKWLDWVSNTLSIPMRQVFINLIRTPENKRDMDAVNDGIITFETNWTLVDKVLEKQKWLSGDHFGIADIPMGCYAYNWFEMPIEHLSHPHLERWYQQLQQRLAFNKQVMTPLS